MRSLVVPRRYSVISVSGRRKWRRMLRKILADSAQDEEDAGQCAVVI